MERKEIGCKEILCDVTFPISIISIIGISDEYFCSFYYVGGMDGHFYPFRRIDVLCGECILLINL